MSSQADTIVWKNGDVYRWRYNALGSQRDLHWCCSCIGIVSNGRIVDTYWGQSGENRSFNRDDLPRLSLTFFGNLADFEKRGEHEESLYAPDDIMNLNHANSSKGNFYVRKGAKRDAAVILETISYKIDKARSAIKSAEWDIQHLSQQKARVESGDLSDIWF